MTFNSDFQLLSKLKIGFGYDVHKLVRGRSLIIGGVNIPFELGLEGHSDADVLVHAIIDSILGAAKIGDIGQLFPDTDTKYKDANSIYLLSNVEKRLHRLGLKIIDIDSVIVAQSPRMMPYRQLMQQNISNALKVDLSCIGIKATTTEGCGPEGRSECISAKAACLLVRCK